MRVEADKKKKKNLEITNFKFIIQKGCWVGFVKKLSFSCLNFVFVNKNHRLFWKQIYYFLILH